MARAAHRGGQILTEDAKPVIDGDNEDASRARKDAAIVCGARVPLEAFAVNEHHHGIAIAGAGA